MYLCLHACIFCRQEKQYLFLEIALIHWLSIGDIGWYHKSQEIFCKRSLEITKKNIPVRHQFLKEQ